MSVDPFDDLAGFVLDIDPPAEVDAENERSTLPLWAFGRFVRSGLARDAWPFQAVWRGIGRQLAPDDLGPVREERSSRKTEPLEGLARKGGNKTANSLGTIGTPAGHSIS
jgi:hypothetical protein